MTSEQTAKDLMRTDFVRFSDGATVRDALVAIRNELTAKTKPTIGVLFAGATDSFEGLLPFWRVLEWRLECDENPGARLSQFAISDIPPATPDETLLSLIAKTVESPVGAVPVLLEGRLEGVVLLSDLFDCVTEKILLDLTTSFDANA